MRRPPPTLPLTRRSLLKGLSAAALGLASAQPVWSADQPVPFRLGFSLYGMRDVEPTEAIRHCHAIGYQSVELAVMSGWPGDSLQLEPARAREIRQTLRETGTHLAGLMENLPLLGDAAQHDQNLLRLRRAIELGRSWSTERAPVVETILGGRPDRWEQDHEAMRDRLRDWRDVAQEAGGVLAIKPHVSGAMHLPEQALWLVEQIDSPHVKLAYDFSHFQLRGRDLETTLRQLLPFTVFIHVKDAEGTPDRARFLLPGEGTVDYRRYFEILLKQQYQGDVVVEVSGQIHSRADYDGRMAAEKSYRALAPPRRRLFEAVGAASHE